MYKLLLGIAAAVGLAGCASSQLNYNTLEIASTVAGLQKKQVLANISKFVDDPDAIPDQVAIASGSVGTTNSITETLTDSLTKSNVVAASLSATRTVVAGLSSGGTNQQTQSWSIAPNSDGDNLRRLQALYRFAVIDRDVDKLYEEYPVHRISFAPDPTKLPQLRPDPFFQNEYHRLWIRDNSGKLVATLCTNWIFTSEDQVFPQDEVVPLGHFGNHDLFTTASARNRGCLSKFVLAILDAAGETTSPTVTSSASKAGGGGGGGSHGLIAPPSSGPMFTPDQAPPRLR